MVSEIKLLQSIGLTKLGFGSASSKSRGNFFVNQFLEVCRLSVLL